MPLTNGMFPGIQEVYLDGEFMAPADARVSVFDRGFIFGDGIYEVIAAYGGKPFRLSEHLERLERNLGIVRIDNPLCREQWQHVLGRLLDASPGLDQYIYIQVTRGIAPRNHAFPTDTPSTVFIYAQELIGVDEVLSETGVTTILRPDIRWARCDLKTTSLIAATWLRQEASEEGAEEAILVRDGQISEGAASNVFIVEEGRVLTPPHGPELLPGVTRDLLVELLREKGPGVVEETFSEQRLLGADEVWISSTIRELLPVVKVNDGQIGKGVPGLVYARANSLFQDYKRTLRDTS